MKSYIDSSVILRVVLGQKDSLAEWKSISVGITSALTEVECLRTLDRLSLRKDVKTRELAIRRSTIYEMLQRLEVIELSRPVLARAGHPFPTPLGTLDAIHLASALLWRDRPGESNLFFATHDLELGLAAKSSGFAVLGV